MTKKIEDMLRRLKAIEEMDLSYERRKADEKVSSAFDHGLILDFTMGEFS